MSMQLSPQGEAFIKSFESFVDRPYDDGAGYLTIGWGHLIKPGEKFTRISREQGDAMFRQDVGYYVDLVNRLVKVPLTQQMFDALVSLAYNWRDFPSSSHLRLLNNYDYAGAARRIGEHPITGGGKVMNGLVRRRRAESDLFMSGGLPDGSNFPKPPRPTTTAAAKKKTVTRKR